ncbi:glycosyltransferase family 39 protein [bacterium]|nr:glycosyltransferase family 39 protein [bacterium]
MLRRWQSIDFVLPAAVLAGFIFRIILWKTTRFMINFDEANYLRLAGHALDTGWFAVAHPYWSPFYPFMIRLAAGFGGDLESAARWVGVLCGTGMIPFVYLWANRLFGRPEARVAAVLMALYPPLASESVTVMPEALYILTGLGGWMLGWKAVTAKKWIFGLLAGMCWGLAYLTKPEGAGFLIAFGLYLLLFWAWRRGTRSFREAAVGFLIAAAGFLAVASPYLIYLKHNTGHWTISTKGMLNQQMEVAVYFNDGPIKDPFFRLTTDNQHLPYDMGMHFGTFQDLEKLSEGKHRIVHISAGKYAAKYAQNVARLMRETLPQTFGLFLVIPLILGFFTPATVRRKAFSSYLLIPVLFYWFIVVPVFHINMRYIIPLLPLMLVWASAGCLILIRWIADLLTSRFQNAAIVRYTAIGAVVAFLLAGVFVMELVRAVSVTKQGPGLWAPAMELKRAGIWLKSRSDSPPILMSLNKAVDYYAGQNDMSLGASFSYDPVEQNIAYARYRGCEYLVFSSRYIDWFRNLAPLLGESVPGGLNRVYDITGNMGIRTVIYQLEPEEQ